MHLLCECTPIDDYLYRNIDVSCSSFLIVNKTAIISLCFYFHFVTDGIFAGTSVYQKIQMMYCSILKIISKLSLNETDQWK